MGQPPGHSFLSFPFLWSTVFLVSIPYLPYPSSSLVTGSYLFSEPVFVLLMSFSSYYIVSCLGNGILTLFSLDSLYLGMSWSCSSSYSLYTHFGFPLPSALCDIPQASRVALMNVLRG